MKTILKKIVRFPLEYKQKQIKSVYLKMGNSIDTGIHIRLDVPRPHNPVVSIGDGSIVGANFIFESDQGEVVIGNNSFLGGCNLISRSKITIGDFVQIAWGTYLYDHNAHAIDLRLRREDILREYRSLSSGENDTANKNWNVVKVKPIVIEDDVWIGMNCMILKGVTIGRGSVIGAGSVVRKTVPPFCVVCGNPAKVVRFIYSPDEIEDVQKGCDAKPGTFVTKENYIKLIDEYLNTIV